MKHCIIPIPDCKTNNHRWLRKPGFHQCVICRLVVRVEVPDE